MNARATVPHRFRLFAACGALATAAVLAGCSTEPPPPVARGSVTPASSPTIEVGTTTSTASQVASVPSVPQVIPTPDETRAAAATGRPDDSRAQFLLGLSLWKSGKPDLAEPVLERAAGLDPKSVKTWINLARVRLDLNEAATALEAADTALALDGHSAPALHQRGRALALLGRRDEALETVRLALEADPTDGYVANTLGYWLLQSGRAEEAIPFLESARDRLGGVAYVRNNLGVAYERIGRLDAAVEEYRAAVESGDSGGKAAGSLARLGRSVTEPVAEAH